MAYSNNIRNKFIEMRAKDMTMSEISRELKISLPTLDKWKDETKWEVYEFEKKLSKEREIETEKLITERVKFINTELEKAYKALEKSNISKMKTKNLLYLIEKLENGFEDPLLKGKTKPQQEKKLISRVIDKSNNIIQTSEQTIYK